MQPSGQTDSTKPVEIVVRSSRMQPVSFFEEQAYDNPSASSTPRGESPSPSRAASESSGGGAPGHLNTIKSVHQFCASSSFIDEQGAVTLETLQSVCGRGFAPWEVHRPQQAVRELLTAGSFKGSVLDCGCGIGDNSLFIAKYTNCTVDAVDLLPPCIAFAEMKAGLRNMRNRVGWHCFDLMEWDSSPLAGRTYDVILDCGLLHLLAPAARLSYLDRLHALLKPGGTLHLLVISDQERNPGGPGRVSRGELESLLGPGRGWSLTSLAPHRMELHPTFWGGKAQAYLAAAHKAA